MSLLFTLICTTLLLLTSHTHAIHLVTQFYNLPHLTKQNFTEFVDVRGVAPLLQEASGLRIIEDGEASHASPSRTTQYILFYQPWQLPYIPGIFQWYYETREFCRVKGSDSGKDFIYAVDASNSAEIPLTLGIRVTEPLLWNTRTNELMRFEKPREVNGKTRLLGEMRNVACERISDEKRLELDAMWRPKAGREIPQLKVWRTLGISVYVITTLLIAFWK